MSGVAGKEKFVTGIFSAESPGQLASWPTRNILHWHNTIQGMQVASLMLFSPDSIGPPAYYRHLFDSGPRMFSVLSVFLKVISSSEMILQMGHYLISIILGKTSQFRPYSVNYRIIQMGGGDQPQSKSDFLFKMVRIFEKNIEVQNAMGNELYI